LRFTSQLQEPLESRTDAGDLALEIEPAHVIAIEQPVAGRWRTLDDRHGDAAIEASDEIRQRAR
jgi:hypothetical protein